jgi:hypothetical protein
MSFVNGDFTGHLFLETLLVVVIAFLLLQKSYQPEKRPLTEQVNSLSLSLSLSLFHAVDLPLSLHNDKLFFPLPVSTTYFLD